LDEPFESSEVAAVGIGKLDAALRTTARGVLVLALFSGLVRVVRFASEILVGRQLGPELYGVFVYGVMSTLLLPAIVMSILGILVPRFHQQAVAEERPEGIAETTLFVKCGAWLALVLAALIALIAYPLLTLALTVPGSRTILAIMLSSLPLQMFNNFMASFFLARKQMFFYVLHESVLPIGLYALALVVASFFGLNLLTAAVIFTVGRWVGGLIALNQLLRIAESKAGLKVPWSRYLLYGSPILLTMIGYWLIARLDRWVVAFGLDEKQLGIYSAGLVLALIVDFFVASVSHNLAPHIVHLYYSDRPSLGRYFRTVSVWLAAVLLPVGIAGAVFAPTIVALYGKEFMAAAVVLMWLIVSRALGGAFGLAGHLLNGLNWQWLETVNTTVIGGLAAVALILVVKPYGIVGVAIVWAIANLILQAAKQVECRIVFGVSAVSLRLAGLLLLSAILAALAIVARIECGTPAWLLIASWAAMQALFGAFVFFTEEKEFRDWMVAGLRRRLGRR